MSEIVLHLRRFLLRLLGTVLAALAFFFLCMAMRESVYPELRILSGPVWLLHTASAEAHCRGTIGAVILLPCMFVVGLWRNTATKVLSVLAGLCWVGFAFWIEATIG
jgi:hypothetical protein